MNAKTDSCPWCGSSKTGGEMTFTAELGSGLVAVRRVRATLCSQGGEKWMDDATARRLEQVANKARQGRREVEITAFA